MWKGLKCHQEIFSSIMPQQSTKPSWSSLPLKYKLRHKHQMSCPRPPRAGLRARFQIQGSLSPSLDKTILYFYINIHLHNSSPAACREKPSRLLLSGQVQTYLWEYLGHRVLIVMGWVMPWTRLWEKFAGRATDPARKRYLVINSEGKLFRKGIYV